MKPLSQRDACDPISTAALCAGRMNKEHMCDPCTGILFSHKKGSSAICDNMDGRPGYHTKSDRERETLCDPSMWNLKNQTQRNKSRLASVCVCTCVAKVKTSSYKMSKF